MTGSPVWHPFTQHGLGEPISMVERAKDACLFTRDGRRIVDAISSWWVITHGHCNQRIVDAIANQAQQMDQIIFAGWTHEPAEQLARELVDLLPVDLPHVFYSDSGSTAVEVALKMALGYFANRGEKRHKIVVMEHSYHGDTIGAMSVGARGVFNQAYDQLLFDVETMPFPSKGREQAALDALEAICRGPDIAALIVEPLLLGAGGMLVYDAQTLAEMRAICARYGVLFIADEVMTGFGRTGTLLACEQAKITPDILCLAKGLTGGSVPLAATLASGAIFDAHYAPDRSKTFYHSSSFTANPVSCAAAVANMAIWREEPVLDRLADLGVRQQQGAEALAQIDGIEEVRRCGTMMAIDYRVSDADGYLSSLAPRLLAYFRERDFLLRPLGNTAYVMPPFSISADDLAATHQVMADAVELLG